MDVQYGGHHSQSVTIIITRKIDEVPQNTGK